MTTLIAVYTDRGCVGRCDAKCYNATDPECTCICGGKNHGAGLVQAVDNTRQLAEKWIAEYRLGHDHQLVRFETPAKEPVQVPLF